MATGVSGIKFTVLEGETADGTKEFFFDSSVRDIVIGHDPIACQIVLPEASIEDGIGAEHIGFRRSLGRYQVDLNTALYVEIDRRRPIEDMELEKVHEVKLGKRLKLRLEVIDTRPAPKRVGKQMMQSADLSRRNQRILFAGLVLVAGVAGAVAFTQLRLSEVKTAAEESKKSLDGVVQNVDSLSESLSFLNEQVDTISTDVLNNVSRSVYLVVKADRLGGERAQGTAWVTEGGKLATNAHVADSFNKLKPGESLWVRASVAPYESHKVTEVDLHPGFKRFRKMWNDYLPAQRQGGRLQLMRTASPADVALMTVEQPEKLQPKLELATRDELEALRPGIRVAFSGYPSELLLPGALKSPSPVIQQDEIIRLTNFFMVNQPKGNRLIHHGLPITGGASGSPIIDASGKVIGLISSGNFVFAGRFRTVNAADINFGQRLDFLHSMLENPDEKDAAAYEADWKAQLAEFDSAPDIAVASVRKAIAAVSGQSKPVSERVMTATVSFGEKTLLGKVYHDFKVRFDSPGLYLVRLKAPLLGVSLRAYPRGGDPMTPIGMPLPFTSGLPHKLVFATGTSTLSVTVGVRKGPLDKDIVETALAVERYSVNASSAFLTLLEQSRDFEWNSSRKPVYVSRHEALPAEFKLVNDHYVLQTKLELTKSGKYSFVAIPKTRGVLDGVLLENGVRTMIDRDKRPLVWLDGSVFVSKSKKKKEVQFVTTSTAPIPQDVYVIYWEKVPDEKAKP